MGNTQSISKINFEDVQYSMKNKEIFMLINTLDEKNQDCLIPNTINIHQEEEIINRLISKGKTNVKQM